MSLSATLLPTDTAPANAEADVPLIVSLAEAAELPVALVGNKARRLGQLMQAGLNVPDGFCITAKLPFSSDLSNSSNGISDQILDAWHRLNCDVVAVRSSAIEEDGAQASWAGLFYSQLNVRTDKELLGAVNKCLQSLHSDLARRYRNNQNSTSALREARMAVIIQCQVRATAAGVLFTRDPINPSKDHLCVNAIRGLGEPLVSGQQSGDSYRISPSGRLIQSQLNHQPELLSTDGIIAIPQQASNTSVLAPLHLKILANTGRQIEAQFGTPQDIEFAFEEETLWLTQSRPIVLREELSEDDISRYKHEEVGRLGRLLNGLKEKGVLQLGPSVLTNSNIGELLPLPTPMSFDLFQKIFTGEHGAITRGRQRLGYTVSGDVTQSLFTLVAGQPYFHLELDARTYDVCEHQPIADYLDKARCNPLLANYPEYGLYRQHPDIGSPWNSGTDQTDTAFNHSCKRHYQTMVSMADQYYQDYQNNIAPMLQSQHPGAFLDQNEGSAQNLLDEIYAIIRQLQTESCYHFVIAARLGFYFADSIRYQLSAYLPETAKGLMGQLLQALPGSRITEHMLDLAALKSGSLSKDKFIEQYGHLATTELEISLPRYRETPQHLESLKVGGEQSAIDNQCFMQQIRQRKSAERKVRKLLNEHGVNQDRIDDFFRDLRFAQRYLPLRETIKYHFAKGYAQLRDKLLRFADKVEINRDLLFYLEVDELELCLFSKQTAVALMNERQLAHRLSKAVARSCSLPPIIFGDDLDTLFGHSDMAEGNDWQGEGIAPGFRRGRFRIIDDEVDMTLFFDQLGPDDIVVTRSLNLGLAPVLHCVAGLIVEVGGFLAHGACQAREAGIPAVVLPGATKILGDGVEAILDGSKGVVRVF